MHQSVFTRIALHRYSGATELPYLTTETGKAFLLQHLPDITYREIGWLEAGVISVAWVPFPSHDEEVRLLIARGLLRPLNDAEKVLYRLQGKI